MNILVVDDEQDICEILQFNLVTEGYSVVTANSAEEALRTIAQIQAGNPAKLPNLILLDVMMEGMSGFQMARQLKASPQTAHIPIIFITALDDEDHTVKGLNIGADDYIAKPLSIKEVKARVNAVLRRVSSRTPSAEHNLPDGETLLTYEDLTLNLSSKTATLGSEQLMLTKLEFELLSLFLRHPGTAFSREELLARCWPSDTIVLDRTVDVNITRLRKKTGSTGKHIKTRIGYGYYFEK